jgi:heterodisulfide reductase subunit B2
MNVAYYPGCTLKSKARNLEDAALASLAALGVQVTELERWNCCGAVFTLADDDLIHLVAPVRNLVRAKDAGAAKLMTICGQCYNVLWRANRLMRDDEAKRKTLNLFMDEETDYHGEVEVVHYLELLRDEVGWDELRRRVRRPLGGLRVAPFHGCALLRPAELALGGSPTRCSLFEDFLSALGAVPVKYPASDECCGAYQALANPAEALMPAVRVLSSAIEHGAEALALTCPLCEHNLGRRQAAMRQTHAELPALPTYYFTQLLATALGLEPQVSHFELNMERARTLLDERHLLGTPHS